jgi:hypothetical protein
VEVALEVDVLVVADVDLDHPDPPAGEGVQRAVLLRDGVRGVPADGRASTQSAKWPGWVFHGAFATATSSTYNVAVPTASPCSRPSTRGPAGLDDQPSCRRGAGGGEPRPRGVVLEASAVHQVTIPFLDALERLHGDLAEEGIAPVVAGLPAPTLEVARRSSWFGDFERDGWAQPTVDAAVARARA